MAPPSACFLWSIHPGSILVGGQSAGLENRLGDAGDWASGRSRCPQGRVLKARRRAVAPPVVRPNGIDVSSVIGKGWKIGSGVEQHPPEAPLTKPSVARKAWYRRALLYSDRPEADPPHDEPPSPKRRKHTVRAGFLSDRAAAPVRSVKLPPGGMVGRKRIAGRLPAGPTGNEVSQSNLLFHPADKKDLYSIRL